MCHWLVVIKMGTMLIVLIDQERNTAWINGILLEHSVTVGDEQKNYQLRTVWLIVLLFNLVVFIITKLSMLKLTLSISSILRNPHDTLFFIDEMEKLIVTPMTAGIIVYDLSKNNGPPFSEITPNCGFRTVFPLFVNIQFLGGMAIALMRYIAIRHTQIMARWGEVKMMGAILILWHTVLIGNTYLMAVNSIDNYRNRCYSNEESSVTYRPGPIFMFSCVAEFVIYVSICHFVYKSDKEVGNFISSESYRRRKRKNAFNIFGHAIYFSIELTMIFGTIIFINLDMRVWIKVWHQFSSTLMSIFMLLLSKPMKIRWTQLFTYIQQKSREQMSRVPAEHEADDNLEMKSIEQDKS